MTPKQSLKKNLLELYSPLHCLGWFDRAFIRARTGMLPLEELDRLVPKKGRIIEIGCGHGLITNYLAMTSPNREVTGVDIDARRIEIAQATVGEKINIKYLKGYFQDFDFRDVDMVILFGVLCLIPFSEWDHLFKSIHRSLHPQGRFLLHDIKKEKKFGYWIHEKKEDLFRILRITQGAGFFVREPHELEAYAVTQGFIPSPLTLNVPYHSCLNFLLAREDSCAR